MSVIKIEDINKVYGALNAMAENPGLRGERRGTDTTSMLSAVMEEAFTPNCLLGKTEYNGIIVGSFPTLLPSYESGQLYTREEYRPEGEPRYINKVPRYINKVLVPELECRPINFSPTGQKKGLTLKQRVYTLESARVKASLDHEPDQPLPVGSVCTVLYGDINLMKDPVITSIGAKVFDIDLEHSQVTLADRYRSGTARTVIQGRVSPEHDRYLDKLLGILEREKFEVTDEYREPNRHTTAPHFHFQTRASTTLLQDPASTPNADAFRLVLKRPEYDHITEKGSELSNGGDITVAMKDKLIVLLGILNTNPDFNKDSDQELEFTGGNDEYHQRKHPNSRHRFGEGIDLVLTVGGTRVEWE